MNFKLAVFDIAGTTVADQDAVAQAFIAAFKNYGLNISVAAIKPLMGYKKTLAIETVLRNNGRETDEFTIETIHNDFISLMVNHYAYDAAVKPMEGAEDVFVILKKQGVRIALNTGFPRVIADTIVNRLQWKKDALIDDYIASDEVEKGRPFPFMINELMFRAGLHDPKQVLKAGDTEVDINEGRSAGCGLVIGVTTGAFTRQQLEPYRPDFILDNLLSLPEIILH